MTTSTTAEVGHGGKKPTVVEIAGFRGRLISADHAEYDIARAVWNGAIDRRPRLIARCIGTADVVAAEDLLLGPGDRAAVATGFAIAVPDGYEVQVRPRSGLALKHGITCLNTPGTIDSDYRGEIKVILANLGSEPFSIRRGDRIAQLVPAAVTRAGVEEVASLDDTARGGGGFGSTGR